MNGFLPPPLTHSLTLLLFATFSLSVSHCASDASSLCQQVIFRRRATTALCLQCISMGLSLIVLHSCTPPPPWGPRLLCSSPSSNEDHLSSLCLSPWHVIPRLCTSFHAGSVWGFKICLFCHVILFFSLTLSFYTSVWTCHARSCLHCWSLIALGLVMLLYLFSFFFLPSLKLPHSCSVSSEPTLDHQRVRLEAKSVFVWEWERDGFSPEVFLWKQLWGLLQVRITHLHLSQVAGPEHRIAEVFKSAYW